MRIALVHNPNAGHGAFERNDLRRLIEARGHRVEPFGKKKDDIDHAIAWAPDVIAVAGGDGTVSRAAVVSFSADSKIPLLILALGTSNNIARSLGVARPVPEAVAELETLTPGRLDIGRVSGDGDDVLFVEGAGVGFLGAMLRHPPSLRTRAVSAVRGLIQGTNLATRIARGTARFVRRQPALPISVIADGAALTDEYIAVEALNIREAGPRLALAPQADCGDGLLDLVVYRKPDADELAHCIERSLPLPIGETQPRRARRIDMTWRARYGHIDDEPWPDSDAEADVKVIITVAGQVNVLQPSRSG